MFTCGALLRLGGLSLALAASLPPCTQLIGALFDLLHLCLVCFTLHPVHVLKLHKFAFLFQVEAFICGASATCVTTHRTGSIQCALQLAITAKLDTRCGNACVNCGFNKAPPVDAANAAHRAVCSQVLHLLQQLPWHSRLHAGTQAPSVLPVGQHILSLLADAVLL